MSDLDQLRGLTGQFRPPPFEDLVAVSGTRRRRSAIGAGAAATAAVIAVTAVATGVGDRGGADQDPVAPTPSITETAAINGRIQGIEKYLLRVRPECGSCEVSGTSFEEDTGRLLVTWTNPEDDNDFGIGVVGPDEELIEIGLVGPNELLLGDGTCNGERPCGSGLATLGPGPDEVSVQKLAYGSEVQVLGFDGTVRRTFDLSAAVGGEQVRGLAWSPDGSRLAVMTRRFPKTSFGTAVVSNIWLVDRDGGEPQLVHTVSNDGSIPDGNAPAAFIGGIEWSRWQSARVHRASSVRQSVIRRT